MLIPVADVGFQHAKPQRTKFSGIDARERQYNLCPSCMLRSLLRLTGYAMHCGEVFFMKGRLLVTRSRPSEA